MARRKKGGGDAGPGSGDWLNTYADMVTLLLTFFILLFSMSSLDAAKFNMLVEVFKSDNASSDQIVIFSEGTGDLENQAANMGESEEDLEDLSLDAVFQQIKEYIEAQGVEDSVLVAKSDNYIFIRFQDEIIFMPNSARLRDPNMEILNIVGNGVKSIEDQIQMISINGHTAAIPNDPNYEVSDRLLSSERANVILMYLEDSVGVNGDKLNAVSWGKWVPVTGFEDNATEEERAQIRADANATEEQRAQNRRVEILISTDNPIEDQLYNVYEKLMDE